MLRFFLFLTFTFCFVTHSFAFNCNGHLSYGIPSDADQMLCRDGYAIGYSYQARQPFWVGYKLTTMSVAKKVERYDEFRPDPQIPEPYQSKLDDYRKSGYDRGHLAPYASMDFTYEAGNQSFLLSNISPQRPGFNRQGWRYIEAYVRAWAAERGEIYVFTGPLFERDIGHIGDGVLIPSHFWKVAYDPEDQQMIAFLVPHVDFHYCPVNS